MHFTKSIVAASACISAAFAATHQIQVGTNGQRVFDPPTVNAAVGDTVQFIWVAGNHTVTSGGGSSSAACQPSGKFNSGFLIGTAGKTTGQPTFSLTVKDTNPITFYCAQNQNDHCQASMVGAINPSTDDNNPNSLVQLQRAASQTKISGVAQGVTGGTVGTGNVQKNKRELVPSRLFKLD
ncbi:uncharacterized protein PV09_07739 [Verruconis gallopava]|uniref:Phytocyanin domain-containing protein n=1 Tax=Verruconis gallopava TaxID=253628 RepID=A0A0D2A1X2_9PEZI|nr:uncharacterized protein PV09_07739 [Verruconis gallopava]KIW00758.1 hypothetical protein PV09_07739 [Verruconis gallopava]